MCRANGKARVELRSPRRTRGSPSHKGKDLSSWSSCPQWSKTGFIHRLGGFVKDDLLVVRGGCAATQSYRRGYRSVTLGNGDVLRRTAITLGISQGARPSRPPGGASRGIRSDKDVPGGTPTPAHETPALASQSNSKRFKPIQTNPIRARRRRNVRRAIILPKICPNI